ncbi:MAG TPA: DUF1552 domain-containing protein [Polyangiales bacterium]
MSFRLSRRSLLRGWGGVAIGLPTLECMLNANGTAYAQTNEPIARRFALLFAGQSLGGDGWERDKNMVAGRRFTEAGHFIAPASAGSAWEMTTPLTPLSALRADFSIVSGMAIPFSKTSVEASAVPPGGAFRDFHGGGAGPLLCGTRSESASFVCRSITSDQLVAKLHAGKTPTQSLVLRAQPVWYLSGSSFSGRQYISYGEGGQRIEAQPSPQIAFNSLFSGFKPSAEGERVQFEYAQRGRKSVLDVVLEKQKRLLARVSAGDRARLERHFDELRALELRVAAVPPTSGGACVLPSAYGADPAVGGNNAGSSSDTISTNTGYSDEDARAKLMADLIYMAFVCDLTRVASLQITCFQSHMNVFKISEALGLPIRADQHEAGHNGDANNRGQLPVSTLLKWHVSIYAQLLAKLKSVKEGDGSVLDHSVVLFVPEGGHGVQLNDASSLWQTHSVEDMVMLVAGGAGGLKPGRHIKASGVHPARALISAMRAAGHTADRLGEVQGTIPELFG